MLRVAGVRALTIPLAALAALTSAWLIVHDVGAKQFGVVTLVTTLVLLLPFADLGLSAPLINAFAGKDEDRYRTLTVAWTWLWIVAAVLSTTVIGLHIWAGWDRILGVDVPSGTVCLALVVFACSVPIGVGMRILTGLGLIAVVSVLQLVFPIVALTLNLLAYVSGHSNAYLVVPSVAQFASACGMFVFALTRLEKGRASWRAYLGLDGRAGRLFRGGAPMLVISVGLALALQSHRLVLSHWSTREQLASYALAMTIRARVCPIGKRCSPTVVALHQRAKESVR